MRSGENGFVATPDGPGLARAISQVQASVDLARRLGAQARQDVAGLTWAEAVKRLVIV